MGRMIPDAKLLFDQHRDTRCGPDLTAKAIMLSSFCQQVRQLGPLRLVQAMLRARGRLMTQGICSARLGFCDPLTYRSLSDSECGGDGFLFPVVLIELPGAQASIFAPVGGKKVFCVHASFHRLVCFSTLGPHAEVNKTTSRQ